MRFPIRLSLLHSLQANDHAERYGGRVFIFSLVIFFTEPNPRAENRLCYLLKTKFGHVRRKWKGVNMLVCLLLLEQWIGGGGVANTGTRHVYGLGA